MRIGKNIYTTSNKKNYQKPVLAEVEIDRDIVLMNTSGNDDGPPLDPTSSLPDSEPTKTQPPSKSSNPFGGGTPDYER